MRAQTKDIEFAEMVARHLRASIRPVPADDLYWVCENAERALAAELYESAAKSMRDTGDWRMPDDAALARAHDMAWGVLSDVGA